MPSPLNLRARLRALFGRGSGPQQATSDEQVLEELSDELTKAMHLLAGGREECKKIYKWMKDNPEIDEVFAHTTKCSELSFLIQETSFARVIRRYEKELGLEPRVLGNQEIQNILDGGRHIRAIRKEAGSDEIHFAYTMGNSTRDQIVPELLCFFPGAKTCGYVLNAVSNLLIEGKIAAPRQGEIREVNGVIGKRQHIPVRLRLLDGEVLEYSRENWTTGVPKGDKYPVLLVDVPDVYGYFPFEDECDERVKSVFPPELMTDEVTSVAKLDLLDSDLPLTAESASECMRYIRQLVNRSWSEEEDKEMTEATWVALCNLEDWMDPNYLDEDDDIVIRDNCQLLRQCTYVKGAKEWVLERLDPENSSVEDVEEDWSVLLSGDINSKTDDPPIFQSREEVLDQIQWNLLCQIADHTLETVTNKEKLDEMLKLAEEYQKAADSLKDE